MIRQARFAGTFYPEDPGMLQQQIAYMLKTAEAHPIRGRIKALIVPHAGYIYSGQTAAIAYKILEQIEHKPRKIVLLGPAHTHHISEIVADDNSVWRTPLGETTIAENPFPKNREAHRQEHCLEVQLPFLQAIYKDQGIFQIVPLLAGEGIPEKMSASINNMIDNETLLIISTDLSHYREYEESLEIDRKTIHAINQMDYENFVRNGDACGKTPVSIGLIIGNQRGWKCQLLGVTNSGDVTGDKKRVVGYASFVMVQQDE